MDGGEDNPYLRVSGLSVYSDSYASLEALLPITVRMDIGNATYSYYINSSVLAGSYSPCGNHMAYYVILSSTQQMEIPTDDTTFEIQVTVTAADETTLSFTEDACVPYPNHLTVPATMYTGRAYECSLSSLVPVGEHYQSTSSLVWAPQAVGVYTTQVYEEGYVDPYVKVSEATTAFSMIYYAVANADNLQSDLAAAASISFKTVYLSDDFPGGCVITELRTSTMIIPDSEVDANLTPEIVGLTVSGSPSDAVVNGKYVHKRATMTFVPVVRFKYGDSYSYINTDLEGNRYGSSVSVTAVGITPGETYTRPDTGATETAGEVSVRSLAVRVCGRKWKLTSDTYTVYYNVLYYLPPRIVSLNVYRMAVSSTSTAYRYNGTYYKKDDFGAYGMAEYQVAFSSLDSENQTSVTVQYGTHRVSVTPDANGYGFVVFPANTSVAVKVNVVLYDNYMPYGVSASRTLSTGTILLDYLSGGKGMAVGKAATEANALDISSDWKLLFYKATVGGYTGDNAEDLIAWMHNVDSRLDYLENSIYAN